MNVILVFECNKEDIEDIERVCHETQQEDILIAEHATANGALVAVYPAIANLDEIDDVICSELPW